MIVDERKNPMNIVGKARKRIEKVQMNGPLTTGEVRKISASMFRELENKDIDHVLSLSEALLKEGSWAFGIIAYDWAFRVRDQYSAETFYIFERWLQEYVRDWSDCDDFCTHALGALIAQDNSLFDKLLNWTNHQDFWVRRGAAVSLIYPIRKQCYQGFDPLMVSDRLLHDQHELVRKGYGWMLKVLSQQEPKKVYRYLERHKDTMPRVAFRYGMEKLSKEEKQHLMKK